MKAYSVEYVRIEHNVYRFNIVANSEQEARDMIQESIDWDDYDTVHAEEYTNSIECLEDNDE